VNVDEFSPECDCPPRVGGACLAHAAEQLWDEVNRRGAAIERVRELHEPREEILYYRKNEPVRGTVCSTCMCVSDDEDRAGNRFQVREHEDWPCDTVRALDGPS
jgi:hypothetical protein